MSGTARDEGTHCGDVCDARNVSDNPLLSGDIAYFRMPEVMHMVALQRLTGLLRMVRDDAEVDVYFRDGEVAFATAQDRDRPEQLGGILLRMGRITEAELQEAVAKSEETGVKLGATLMDLGHAREDSITSALTKQTERSVYRAMGWSEGRFEFGLCLMPDFVEEFPLGLKVEGLILEGMRRTEQMRVVTERIPSLDIVFSGPLEDQDGLRGLGLSEGEARVARLVDGSRDVREVIRASGMGEFEVLKALNALFTAGLIKKLKKTSSDDRTGYL